MQPIATTNLQIVLGGRPGSPCFNSTNLRKNTDSQHRDQLSTQILYLEEFEFTYVRSASGLESWDRKTVKNKSRGTVLLIMVCI
jgi:hypothetical protein